MDVVNLNKVKFLFLSFNGYSEYNGISKKKRSQIRGLKDLGLDVFNCYYCVDPIHYHRLWIINDIVLFDLGKGFWAKIKKRIYFDPILSYIKTNSISFVYIRSDHNANPFTIYFIHRLKKAGIQVVMEIPTYPYDQEYITLQSKLHLFIDRLFRKRLSAFLDAIVTFSNYSSIFGKRTIQISNGIDFSAIPLKQNHTKPSEIHLIGVAEIHYWHGFDRVVAGLVDYYQSGKVPVPVYFHIVGAFSGERERKEILPLIKENNLEKYVVLHGQLFGKELDDLFDISDIGIGSLGRHRSNITYIKTLKNREYAARGIPFVYSEIDEDFEQMPYVLKAPADETPVNIQSLIEFYKKEKWNLIEIRESVSQLSWKNQMQKVIDAVCYKKEGVNK